MLPFDGEATKRAVVAVGPQGAGGHQISTLVADLEYISLCDFLKTVVSSSRQCAVSSTGGIAGPCHSCLYESGQGP
jgi:hypothetical protein